jgi:hypothetical protein
MDLVSVCKNTPKINTHYLNKKKKKKRIPRRDTSLEADIRPPQDSSYK